MLLILDDPETAQAGRAVEKLKVEQAGYESSRWHKVRFVVVGENRVFD